jgi:hypothetical protein
LARPLRPVGGRAQGSDEFAYFFELLHDGNVANERDFYRLKEMTEAEFALVARMVEPMAPEIREVALGWVAMFREPFTLWHLYKAGGRKSPEFEAQFDITVNNLEEDIHAKIESAALPVLAELRKGRDDFMNDGEMFAGFSWFIAAQYMRTPTIMNRSVSALRALPGGRIEAMWGLLRTMFATSLGHAINARRGVLQTTFLEANTPYTFITGDQPVVNLRPGGQDGEAAPDELELFFPVSPTLAVSFTFDGASRSTKRRRPTFQEVEAFNRAMVRMHSQQLYAATEADLLRFLPSPP